MFSSSKGMAAWHEVQMYATWCILRIRAFPAHRTLHPWHPLFPWCGHNFGGPIDLSLAHGQQYQIPCWIQDSNVWPIFLNHSMPRRIRLKSEAPWWPHQICAIQAWEPTADRCQNLSYSCCQFYIDSMTHHASSITLGLHDGHTRKIKSPARRANFVDRAAQQFPQHQSTSFLHRLTPCILRHELLPTLPLLANMQCPSMLMQSEVCLSKSISSVKNRLNLKHFSCRVQQL